VKQYPGEVLRWALLSGHYRSPLDWTPELLEQSRASLDRLYGFRRDIDAYLKRLHNAELAFPPKIPVPTGLDGILKVVIEALLDDLNTPGAISQLFDLAGNGRRYLAELDAANAKLCHDILLEVGDLLGVLQQDPDAWFEGGADEDFKAKVDDLLKARHEARAAKDFATADRIRGELDALNVMVMDNPTGATWRMKD